MSAKGRRLEQNTKLEEVFCPDGLLAQRLPGYEFRPSQLRMAQAVLDAIRNRSHLCVEAGTGTGKTLAYLVPALYSAKRVIVSTATKNLQEQIFFSDLPFLRKHLAPNLEAAYMKGRNNYLCLKKFYEQDAQSALFREIREERRRLAGWVEKTETGDRAEIDWAGEEHPIWRHLDARSDTCTGNKCQHFDRCFVTRMRQKAQQSDIIVVNHSLFFSNLALKTDEVGQILPDFGVAILDEAHELEDIAAGHFGLQLSNYQVEELTRDTQRSLGRHPRHLKAAAAVLNSGGQLFAACPGGDGSYSLNFFRDPREGIVDLRDRLLPSYRRFHQDLERVYHGLMSERELPDDADALRRRAEFMLFALHEIFEENEPAKVYWYEKRGRGVFLRLTPIEIAPILRESLFREGSTAILTSATLAVEEDFEFIRSRLGLTNSGEVTVPSEFDYRKQAMLYVPSGYPEPRSPLYLERALADILRLLEMTQGHAFLLFTSFQQLRRIHEALAAQSPYPLLAQGERPRSQLLKAFKETPNAVLCATSSFWQGVDVRGEALRLVVIDKLPFPVPTEPVFAARVHHLREQGIDPFYGYAVPQAVIALKQGMGRLIRSRQDRGILAILDSRLRTRSYGQSFLRSLPNCQVTDKIEDLENFYSRFSSVEKSPG